MSNKLKREYNTKKLYKVYCSIARAHAVYQPHKVKEVFAMPFDWMEVCNLIEDYIEENGDFDALYQEVEKEIDEQNAKLAEVIEKYKAVEVAQVNDQLAKVNDHFVLHSSNGLDYQVYIHNVNDYRPPEMLYACDIVDPEGKHYYEAAGDWYFCGQDFIDKCEYVGKEE